MRYALLLLLLPILAGAQYSPMPSSQPLGLSQKSLGEDTIIFSSDPNRDTVYTIDGTLMDIKDDGIAIGERYYPYNIDKIEAIDINGRQLTNIFDTQIKSIVRFRLVKENGKFIIKRMRVLSLPPIK